MGIFTATLTATQARQNLYRLIDDVADSHHPVRITGPRHNVMVISEEDYLSIQETLYLLSIPGMRESILEGRKEPIGKCAKKPGW